MSTSVKFLIAAIFFTVIAANTWAKKKPVAIVCGLIALPFYYFALFGGNTILGWGYNPGLLHDKYKDKRTTNGGSLTSPSPILNAR